MRFEHGANISDMNQMIVDVLHGDMMSLMREI